MNIDLHIDCSPDPVAAQFSPSWDLPSAYPQAEVVSYRPGASVVLADVPGSPVMTILRHGVWAKRAWYVVAWIDHHCQRHEAFFPEDQLQLADAPVLAA